jgi:hypothetical protein
MNTGKESQNEKLEKLLTKARLHEPSPELRERITTEATRVWKQTSVEVSWRIPLRRLLASAAAAVLVIWLANISSDRFVARWQSDGFPITSQPSSEVDAFQDLPYGPLVKNLSLAKRALPAARAADLRHYVETLRRLLDEAPQNDDSNPPDPAKGRSRLLPGLSNPGSHS